MKNEESKKCEQEYQQLVRAAFDISYKQDIESLNRGSIPNAGVGQEAGLPLPVLALKPDRLLFSMSTTDLRIWKEALIIGPVILTVIQLWNNKHFYSVVSTTKLLSDSSGRSN